jgi:hypothetical protein
MRQRDVPTGIKVLLFSIFFFGFGLSLLVILDAEVWHVVIQPSVAGEPEDVAHVNERANKQASAQAIKRTSPQADGDLKYADTGSAPALPRREEVILTDKVRIPMYGFADGVPLIDAVVKGDVDRLKKYIREGSQVDNEGSDGGTALSHAAGVGRSDMAVLLLQAGADPNHKDDNGVTPLMKAAEKGRLEMVKLLLSKGADPSLRANDGQTAAGMAKRSGHNITVLSN